MRGGTVLPSRPVYYDRNPLAAQQGYEAGGVAPHVATQRTTYTVPTAKKAYGELIELFIIRTTVAGAAGLFQASCTYLPAAGGSFNIGIVISGSNVNFTSDRLLISQFGLLGAGDQVTTTTSDTSTTGAVDYKTIQKYTQFDA